MDFEQWWKLEGQFVPPLDLLISEHTKNQFKKFAECIWSKRDDDVEEARSSGYDEGWEDRGPSVFD